MLAFEYSHNQVPHSPPKKSFKGKFFKLIYFVANCFDKNLIFFLKKKFQLNKISQSNQRLDFKFILVQRKDSIIALKPCVVINISVLLFIAIQILFFAICHYISQHSEFSEICDVRKNGPFCEAD